MKDNVIPPILRPDTIVTIGDAVTVTVSVQRVLEYQNRCEERIARQKESIDRLLSRLEDADVLPTALDVDALITAGLERIRQDATLVTSLVQQAAQTGLSTESFLRSAVLASVLLGQSGTSHAAEAQWDHRLDTVEPVDEATVALAEDVATPEKSLPRGEDRPGHVL